MAADLDRADRGSGGPAGRAALLRGPGVHLQGREEVPAGLEGILSFFVILLSVFDMFGIDCLIVVSD